MPYGWGGGIRLGGQVTFRLEGLQRFSLHWCVSVHSEDVQLHGYRTDSYST